MHNVYKQTVPLETRQAETSRIRARYPDRVPVIVQQSPNSSLPTLTKQKYLIPHDLTVGQFLLTIRQRLKMSSEQSIFLFVDNKLPPTSALFSELYQEHKDPQDGLLYLYIEPLQTFG